jgi:hypothetical protein
MKMEIEESKHFRYVLRYELRAWEEPSVREAIVQMMAKKRAEIIAVTPLDVYIGFRIASDLNEVGSE